MTTVQETVSEDEITDAESTPELPEPILPAEHYNLVGRHHVDTWPRPAGYVIAKRIIDIVGALVLGVLTGPLIAIAALAIKLTSRRRRVIFTQQRAGRLGRPFTMYKLRSMVAQTPHESIIFRNANGRNVPALKLKDDPRITTVGRFLRRTSIDELPQLINVIRGHMSLVGPRPLPLDEVRLDTLPERARLSIKPGLTGLWQVSGRADVPYDEWVELDLYYVMHRSIWLDLQILLRTIPAVITCRGAY